MGWICKNMSEQSEPLVNQNGESTLYCNHCKKRTTYEKKYVTFSTGFKHISAICKECNYHIKYVSQGGPERIYFGKHKGEKIEDIYHNDKGYLLWLLKQEWLENNLKITIQKYV
jgi:RNase P subunit RPR2